MPGTGLRVSAGAAGSDARRARGVGMRMVESERVSIVRLVSTNLSVCVGVLGACPHDEAG